MDDQFFVKSITLEAELDVERRKCWQAEQRVLELEAQVTELKKALHEYQRQEHLAVSPLPPPGTPPTAG